MFVRTFIRLLTHSLTHSQIHFIIYKNKNMSIHIISKYIHISKQSIYAYLVSHEIRHQYKQTNHNVDLEFLSAPVNLFYSLSFSFILLLLRWLITLCNFHSSYQRIQIMRLIEKKNSLNRFLEFYIFLVYTDYRKREPIIYYIYCYENWLIS